MRSAVLVQLAALGTAFVLPNQNVMSEVQIEATNAFDSTYDDLPSKTQLLDNFEDALDQAAAKAEAVFDSYSHKAQDAFEEAADSAAYFGKDMTDKTWAAFEDALAATSLYAEDVASKLQDDYSNAKEWLETAIHDQSELSTLGLKDHFEPPTHRPHDDDKSKVPCDRPHPPKDRRPHPPPHHRPGHGHRKSNLTVYQLISKSKYTTKLAKLVDEYPDVVKALNNTEHHGTVFAPIDSAFDKIPKHAPKPSKKQLLDILEYHLSPEFFPAGRVLVSRTIPTILKSSELGDNPQRLSTNIGLRGLTVNFYSRVVAVNIFASNGVIHGVDSLLIPPPKTLKIIDLLPSEFSTLELGLGKTGLIKTLNETAHSGGTFFAPSNFAFAKLGPRINAFLFSSYGRKYLKALLEYHVVANQTLYSDAYYKTSSETVDLAENDENTDKKHGVPRGYFHVELPTLLKKRSLVVDVARYGRLIEIKINGFSRVAVSDGVAKDGVLHVVSSVLIPPKKLANGEFQEWDGETELTEEELIERLEEHVDDEYEEL